MNSITIMVIIFGIAGILIIGAIIRMIDWYAVFSHFYGNNPKKGRVYVNFGENTDFYDADYVFSDEQFVFYQYRIGKHDYVVAVPFRFKFQFVRGRRIINVDFGSEFANPLCRDDAAIAQGIIRSQTGGLVLYQAVNKNLGMAMINALASLKGIGKSALIILLIVAVIGVGIYFFFKGGSTQPSQLGGGPAVTTPAVTQNYTQEDLDLLNKMQEQK